MDEIKQIMKIKALNDQIKETKPDSNEDDVKNEI